MEDWNKKSNLLRFATYSVEGPPDVIVHERMCMGTGMALGMGMSIGTGVGTGMFIRMGMGTGMSTGMGMENPLSQVE